MWYALSKRAELFWGTVCSFGFAQNWEISCFIPGLHLVIVSISTTCWKKVSLFTIAKFCLVCSLFGSVNLEPMSESYVENLNSVPKNQILVYTT